MPEYEWGSNQPDFFSVYPPKLGSTSYKEYRNISATGESTDEVLQVWNFSDSYATQYRNVPSGGEANNQAYSFGGAKTLIDEMPTEATATYTGSYGSSAKSWNWVAPSTDDTSIFTIVDPNNLWMSNGAATVTANFGSGKVDGELTPLTWKWFDAGWWHYDRPTDTLYAPDGDTYTGDEKIVPGFFATGITLKGNIAGNTYSGTASLDQSFVSTDNPMYGGFFGTNAKETTGIFSVLAVSPDPIGGEYPINDDRRGYLTHSGIFNGKCQAGGACTP
jgi:hypothetical protein